MVTGTAGTHRIFCYLQSETNFASHFSQYLILIYCKLAKSDLTISHRVREKVLMYLGSVSLCIIIYSNKSTNQMHHSLSFIACRLNTAQYVSGILMPITWSLSTAVAASGLPLERGGSSAVGRGRAGRPDHDKQHCYHHAPTVYQRRLLQLISSR
jgi:hypothetical protein